jgi:hypothetical protein
MKRTQVSVRNLGSFLCRRTANLSYVPQTLPVLQEAALELNENEPLPSAGFDANVDIFFFTCPLPQTGQITSLIWLELKTKSSKFFEQSLHTNS